MSDALFFLSVREKCLVWTLDKKKVDWEFDVTLNTHTGRVADKIKQKKNIEKRKRSILWIPCKVSQGTYLALYGESGTCVFASIDVSYSFALQTEGQQKVSDHNGGRCWQREEKVQSAFVYLGRHTFKQAARL